MKEVDIIDIKLIKELAEKQITANGQERYGQAIFNAAMEVCKDNAEELRNTIYDPFYDDDRVQMFLSKLRTK